MKDIKVNNLIKLYTLCLLNKGPKHGYEIIKELEHRMDRNISTSQIYPFLKKLRENDFINYHELGERDKKRYTLTNSGEEFIEIIFGNFENLISSVIDDKLCSCDHCDCNVFGHTHQEFIGEEKKEFCCPHCADAYKNKNSVLS